MRPRSALALVLGAFFALSSPALLAQAKKGPSKEDLDKAREAFEVGEKYYNVGEYEEALTRYKSAYLLSGQAELLFNMGQCYRQLGKNEEAIRSYRNFLKELPGSPQRANVEKLIAELEALVANSTSAKASPPTGPIKTPLSGAGNPEGSKPADAKSPEAKTTPPGPEATPADAKSLDPGITRPDSGSVMQVPEVVSQPHIPAGSQTPAPTPKKSRWPIFAAVGGAVLGGVVLTAALASGGKPDTDLGVFNPF